MATLQDIVYFIETNPDICDTGHPASRELVDQAERFLDLRFPEAYREFLQRWGTLATGPLEFYGICGNDFVNSSVPDAVWYTDRKRRQLGLPKELIILLDNNGDEYYCLDTGDTQRARVVVWDAIAREVSGVTANSLFDFILDEAIDSI